MFVEKEEREKRLERRAGTRKEGQGQREGMAGRKEEGREGGSKDAR